MLKHTRNIIKNNVFIRTVIGVLAFFVTRFLYATYRFKITYINCKPQTALHAGVIFFWHQNILAATALIFRKKQLGAIIISPSTEGKTVGSIAKALRFRVIYGSAFKTTLRLIKNTLQTLRSEKKVYIVGDGSRGPAKKLRPGVSYFSQKSQLPLIEIDCSPVWKLTLHNTWDKFQIPLPFSKIYITIRQITDEQTTIRPGETSPGIQKNPDL